MTTQPSPRLVSVGYEGRTAEELIKHLQEEGVDVLVDVRLNPISRKPGLSKKGLAAALSKAGIGYVHLRELGNPRENREAFRRGDRRAHERFRKLLQKEEAASALRHVSELLDGEVVALLCFEGDHGTCHRRLVAAALSEEIPSLSLATC